MMVAVEVDDLDAFDVADFDGFLAQQPESRAKWLPSFVRPTGELPKLASMKLDKTRLRVRRGARRALLAPGARRILAAARRR